MPGEGDQDGEPEARRESRPPGPRRRGRRLRRAGCRRGARERALRRDGGTGGGVPRPPGAPADAPRPQRRRRPARGRPRAAHLARRGGGRGHARPRVAQHDGNARHRRAEGRLQHAPSPGGHGAGSRALHRRRRHRQRRGDRHRGGGGLVDQPARPPGSRPPARAAGRRAGPIADPAGRLRRRRRGGGQLRCQSRAIGRRPRGRRRRSARLPGAPAAPWTPLPSRDPRGDAPGIAATGGRRRARLHRDRGNAGRGAVAGRGLRQRASSTR